MELLLSIYSLKPFGVFFFDVFEIFNLERSGMKSSYSGYLEHILIKFTDVQVHYIAKEFGLVSMDTKCLSCLV